MKKSAPVTDSSIKTSVTGKRLFFPGAFQSSAYLVPDAETEQRLSKKMRLLRWGFMGGFIAGLFGLFIFLPGFVNQPEQIALYVVTAVLIEQLVRKLVLARDLKLLTPSSEKILILEVLYDSQTRKQSKTRLAFGFGASILFVFAGVWLIVDGDLVMGIACTIMFSLVAVACGLKLFLKVKLAGFTEDK